MCKVKLARAPASVSSGCSFWPAFIWWPWLRVGRDPAKGTIIPLFTPPKDITPPAVRFLTHMGFDNKAFASAVVDMGVKGYLQIKEDGGDYSLIRKNPATSLPNAEERVANKLFGGDQP